MRYLNEKLWQGRYPIAPVKTLQYTRNNTDNLGTFEEEVFKRVYQIKTLAETNCKGINVFWSGGIDSTHILSAFIYCNIPFTLTYTLHSIEEYPAMAEWVKTHPLITCNYCEEEGATLIGDFVTEDYYNVFGDLEPQGLDFWWRTSRNRQHDDYKYSHDSTPWYKGMDENTKTFYQYELDGFEIDSKTKLTFWESELHDIGSDHILLGDSKYTIPFYSTTRFVEVVKRDKRFWQRHCRPYKYIQKQLIYKVYPDTDYYFFKMKCGSAGSYSKPHKTVWLITDEYESVTDYKEAIVLLNKHIKDKRINL